MAGSDAPRKAVAPRRFTKRWVAASVTVALTLLGVFVAPSLAQADGPTTFSNTTAIDIPVSGAANQIGQASPYPSAITVAGMAGAVTKVQVIFHNLTHGSLGDVDAMVVAPTGANLVVLSDVDQPANTLTFSSNATFTFDDSAAGGVPTGNVPTGTYRPTNSGGPESFPAPAPAPSAQTTLAGAFTGINPNGSWQLYIVDDATGDVGQMAGGWSLVITTEVAAVATTTTLTTSGTPSTTGAPVTFTATVTGGGNPVTAGTVAFTADGTSLGAPVAVNASGQATVTTSALAEGTHLIVGTYSGSPGFLTSNGSVSQRVDNQTTVTGNTFCNTGALTIPSQGAASPYPSNITVSGLTGSVTKVTATLNELSHQVPVDLDVMLSGPTPTTNLLLMSDVGGTSPVSGVNVIFDDAAATGVPTPLISGSFKPTDDDSQAADLPFPAPAPAPSGATTLSTFNGASGNGVWSLWVVDDASGDAGSISGGWCLTITSLSATTTGVTSSVNPSTVGQSVTFSATVASGGSPVTSGSVVFTEGATTLATVPVDAAGHASFTTTTLPVGTHTITATYSGTATFGTSSGSVDQVVQVVPTTTALTSSLNPSEVGDSVTFTATVTSSSPVTTGTVTFTEGATTLGTVAVDATGQAAFTTSSLTAATHTITATYSGTATLGTSSANVDQVVDVVPTSTTVASSGNPSTFGAPVTFTATVTSSGSPVTTGSVVFTEGATTLATVPVDGAGNATFTTSTLTVGAHTITATYSGTAAFGTSSGTVTQNVEVFPTVTFLASSSNPSTVGQNVTFTATVTAGGAPVTTGTVTFADGVTVLAADVPLAADGTATFTTSALAAGSHPMSGTYSGTATLATSAGTLNQSVQLVATSATITSSLNPSLVGDAVTFTATITASGSPVTAGSVTFTDGATTLADVPVDAAGNATFTTSTLTAGTHTVTATYGGDATFDTSNASVDQVVLAPVVADAGRPYSVAEGESLTLDGSGSTALATYEWDLNGDSDFSDATGIAPTLTWAQLEALGIDDGPSTHTVTLKVTLGAQESTDTAVLTVVNTAPDTVVTGALTATAGVPFTVKIGADDPSSADMAANFTYTVDWGDGSPVLSTTGPADPPVTHTYAAAGTYTASLTATDKDGGTGDPLTIEVVVSPAAVTPTPPVTTPSAGGGLPVTGADATAATLAGGILLLLGALLVAAGRRRSRRS
ncbi:beta strand repeat-containing protein [Microbacterium sp. B2969]|uniref:Beta strand repeat-containing protein n=1 Tax=Microbacterium alkaliflavum TaxID=3248839 RepID=A0ABW7QDT2_9MICO